MQNDMDTMVIHPKHYNKEGRRECWDEMLEIFGPDAVAIFDILSAYKYKYRAGAKDGNPTEQDLAKIRNYMNHAREIINKMPIFRDESIRGLTCDCWTDMNNILEMEGKNNE